MKLQIIVLLCVGVWCALSLSSWLDTLGSLLKVGDEFTSMVEKFLAWAKEDKGTILVTIENHSNRSALYDGQYHDFAGTITNFNFDVLPGEKQAVAASGKLAGNTEGLIGWNVETYPGMMAVVYWRVRPEIHFKSGTNKLGVGFVNISRVSDIAPSGSDVSIPRIGMRDFSTDGSVIQCCYKQLCLQGIMTDDHHSKAHVRLLPGNVDNLFHVSADPSEDEKLLLDVLNEPNTCTSSSLAGKVSAEFMLLVGMVLVSLWCI